MSSACAGILHRVLQGFELVVQIADAAAAGDRLVEHRTARHLLHVLAEVADGQLPRDGDFALVGNFLADDHAEERGLAGAVGADQSDLLAGIQLKRSVHENQLLAVLLIDVGKGDHRTSGKGSGSRVQESGSRLQSAGPGLATRANNKDNGSAPGRGGQVPDAGEPMRSCPGGRATRRSPSRRG